MAYETITLEQVKIAAAENSADINFANLACVVAEKKLNLDSVEFLKTLEEFWIYVPAEFADEISQSKEERSLMLVNSVVYALNEIEAGNIVFF